MQTSDTSTLKTGIDLTAVMSQRDKETTLDWILAKRKEVLDNARRISSLCNSKISISRLPNEILLVIFRLAQRQSYHNGWLPVSWVCQHWRAVALGSPILWADVQPHGSVDFLLTCLERSRAVKVKLKVEQTPTDITRFGNMIDDHATRVQELELFVDFNYKDVCRAIFAAPVTPLPNLHKLPVLNLNPYNDNYPSVTLFRHNLPCPRLRTLHLLCIDVCHSPDLFSGLVHTDLFRVRFADDVGRGYPHPLQLLLEMLKGCPLLETLQLLEDDEQHDRLISRAGGPEPLSTVFLPRLQLLELHLAEIIVGRLLSHLVLPSSFTARLRIWSQSPGDFFELCVPPDDAYPIVTTHFRTLKMYIQRIPTGCEENGPEGGEGSFDLEVVYWKMPLMHLYVKNIRTAFPSLTRLILVGDIIWIDACCWVQTLRGPPNLVSIHVEDAAWDRWHGPHASYPRDEDDGFAQLFTALTTSPSIPLLCANLEELTAVTFNTPLSGTLEALITALDDRTMNNVPIKKLVLVDYQDGTYEDSGWYDDLEELEGLVDSFTYDPR